MSGICDTCKRNQDCRKPMEGMDSCRLYVSGKESNYKKLFGTPERAARVIVALNNCRVTDCIDCWARGTCKHYGEGGDYDALLEWLRSEGEVIDEPDTIRNELMDSGLLRGDAE